MVHEPQVSPWWLIPSQQSVQLIQWPHHGGACTIELFAVMRYAGVTKAFIDLVVHLTSVMVKSLTRNPIAGQRVPSMQGVQ